jgi:putative ABC transport system permease protein
MDFIRRAWLSTKVKIGRTGLLILVFTAILVFVLAGLTINSAALNATENAKKSVGATVSLSINREAMMQQRESDSDGSKKGFSMSPIPLENIEAIAKSKEVKSYAITSSTSANAGEGIAPITSEESEETTTSESTESNEEKKDGFGDTEGGPRGKQSQGDFQITGINVTTSQADFSEGTSKIISGRGIDASDIDTNNVVIEQDLATENNLKVGSTFKVTSSTDATKMYNLTVVGIFTTEASGDSLMSHFSFMNPSNKLYTSYTFANNLKGDDYKNAADSVIYDLSDPKETAAFVKFAESKVDTDKFQVTSNDTMYQQLLTPLNNISSFAKNIVLLVAIAGVIILTLIIILTIRERKYEIGVLLSLGENKLKVIGQFFIELVFVMVVSVVLAGFSGNIVGNVVGQQLLNQQISTQIAQQAAPATNDKGNDESGAHGGGFEKSMQGIVPQTKEAAQQIKKLNVKVSPKEISYLGLIGLGIALLSVFIASMGILRLQPKAILTSN